PSFAEQIVCFTAPMVGNYGVAEERAESRKAHAKAVLMREARGPAWTDWLHERGVVALTGIDTRSFVLRIREAGAMRACVGAGELPGYDGVLLSPGPGDPAPLEQETAVVRDLVGRTNVLGICLGHQLLALATDHETFKLPFGHRGTNHPVLERERGHVLVTSQ